MIASGKALYNSPSWNLKHLWKVKSVVNRSIDVVVPVMPPVLLVQLQKAFLSN